MSIDLKQAARKAHKLAQPFRVSRGTGFRLADFDPDETLEFSDKDKARAQELLALGIHALKELQNRLYAQDRWSMLVIFQAMDAAGKDSVIKHVMSGINPQGCQVASFKAPSDEELDHDYLWRCQRQLPERGRIGIFNRSYYEEVLVVRVHPEILRAQKLAPGLVGKDVWTHRYEDMRNFESYLARNGTVVRKVFLNVSKGEQKKRFLERLDDPAKNWKFSTLDVKERALWNDYMRAYEEMICHTSTPAAPWYVVPADNKWFTRIVVVSVLIDTLASLDLHYPKVTSDKLKDFAAAKKALLAEKS